MAIQLAVCTDGDMTAPLIAFSGSSPDLVAFGHAIANIRSQFQFVPTLKAVKPGWLDADCVHFNFKPDSQGVLEVHLEGQAIHIAGDSHAFEKLASSLANFFSDDADIGAHFHLDYYPGNTNLAPSCCELIFSCDR